MDTLLGDAGKAMRSLGWRPAISVRQMCSEMVQADLGAARRHRLLHSHGIGLPMTHEA